MDSIFTPDSAFAYLLLVVGLALLGAVGFLLVFANATLLP
jgi:hypothetical protein